MFKKCFLLSLLVLVLLTMVWDAPKANAEFKLSQGMSWEATRFNSGKIVGYENFIVNGSRQWNGEEVWEIQGYSKSFEGSIEKVEETMQLATDMTLRYCEWKFFYLGTSKFTRIVCERTKTGYHHSIYTDYLNIEKLNLEQDIPSEGPVFICEGLFVQLALLVESGKLVETKEYFFLDPSYFLKKEYPIRKLVTSKKQADLLRLPWSKEDFNCTSLVINGSAQIYCSESGKLIAYRVGVGNKKIVYDGNYVQETKKLNDGKRNNP